MKAFQAERLLARAFFGRFFESDLMPPGLPQVRILIWGIAAMAAPGYLRGFLSGMKYEVLLRTAPATLPEAMRADALFFVTFAMMALGFVALIIWEGVFPDRRDVRILGVLPLPVRTHVAARLAALTAVATLFCLGVSLPAGVVYGPVLSYHGPATGALRGIAAHLVVTSMAGLFAFCLVIAAHGVLLNVCGRRLAQRLALVLQLLFVVALLQMFLLLPFLSSMVSAAFTGDALLPAALLPSAWFLALYEVAAGSPLAVPRGVALAAIVATGVSVAGAMALLAGSHGRLVRMALETPDAGSRTRPLALAGASNAIARVLTPHPVQRAVAGFTLRTIARSRTHLMLLTTYLGIGGAILVSSLLPMFVRHGMAALDTPSVPWLSGPLILTFFAVCGMRVIVAIPADIKANWVFRLYASDRLMVQAVEGARIALLLAGVAPVAIVAGLVGVLLWGVQTGGTQAIFTAAMGVLLVDVLLVGLRKIPFACTYYPGRSRARTLWPLYLAAFSVYAFTMARLEAAALNRPALLAGFIATIGILVAVLAHRRRRDLQPPPGLTYEEVDPDSLFTGFQLSEGLAAERVAPRPAVRS